MERKEFNVIKKNRKYFSAQARGCKCKILIDENSEGLKICKQTLLVEDISVRSRWGTDYIYKLACSNAEQKSTEICSLKTGYNSNLVQECRLLGGKFDRNQKAWIFPLFVSDGVEALDIEYNAPKVVVEIRFKEEVQSKGPVAIEGFTIAQARGRSNGKKLGDGVSLIRGDITEGGSWINWTTIIDAESIFRMEIPETFLDRFKKKTEIEVSVIDSK